MIKSILHTRLKDVILQDAIRREITTARRVALLETLWNERYLTRSQLIARVGLRLGKHCFGISAWEDTFYVVRVPEVPSSNLGTPTRHVSRLPT